MKCGYHRWQDGWLAIGLSVFTFLSRIPFRSQILYHWDSVNFAYAMREFSVAKGQPQPPGYIVYVWLCRLVDLVFDDPQQTMVGISIVASVLAVVALFYLGRAMFDRWVGLMAALFWATSPLFWFYGEIALPHSLDALMVIVSVWWLYEVMQGDYRYLYPMVALLAVAGGVRQQTIVFLAPVLLFALRRVGLKRFLLAGALGAGICLAWFVPLMALSGGFSSYMHVMGEFGRSFQSTTSVFMGAGWWGLRRNLIKLTLYSSYGWSVAIIPAAAYAIVRLWRRELPRKWETGVFFFLWIVPALTFYVIVHMGQQGLVFVFLPALLLFSAVALKRLLAAQSNLWIAGTVAIAALNVGIFCLLPEYPLGPGPLRLLTRSTLVNSDHYYQDRFRAIEENFGPMSTAILVENWHHVEYYLPAYKLLPFDIVPKWEWGAGQARVQEGEERRLTGQDLGLLPEVDGLVRIVVFDEDLAPFNDTPELMQVVELDHGGSMGVFALSTDQSLYLGQTFGVD